MLRIQCKEYNAYNTMHRIKYNAYKNNAENTIHRIQSTEKQCIENNA